MATDRPAGRDGFSEGFGSLPRRDAASAAGRRLVARIDPRTGGGRFTSLDGYRAIAAIGVLIYHVAGYAQLTAADTVPAKALHNLGNFGVAVFFLLSGFLLYRPFVQSWFADREAPEPLTYLRRRLVRILPAYFLALSVFLALGLSTAKRPAGDYYFTLYSLTQVYRKAYGFSGLSVAWTLCIEVAFYLALPLLAGAIRALGRHARTLRMKLETQLVGLAVLAGITFAFRWFVAGPAAYDPQTYPYATYHLWLVNYFDWFALGMVLAVCVSWRDAGRRLPGGLQRLADRSGLCLALAAACYAVLMIARTNGGDVNGSVGHETPAQMFVRFGLNGAAAFFFILPGILGTVAGDRVNRVLSSFVPAYLGTVSYGIYLWHKVLIDKLKTGHEIGARRIGFWVMLAEVLALSILTASLSYFFVEKPLMRFKDSRRRPAASAPPRPSPSEPAESTVP